MEIGPAAPATLSLPTNPKSPDTDHAETPTRVQPTKSLPFTNGVLKRHAPPPLHHAPTNPPPPVSYKECMKNHAATMGGHALDGCGEFMPSPTSTPSDPTSLKCAACGCHRNFHRRETPNSSSDHKHHPQPLSSAPTTTTHVIEYHPHHRHHPPPPPPPPYSGRSPNSQSPPPISSSYYPSSAPHMLLALSGGTGGGGSNVPSSGIIDGLNSPHGTSSFGRKRFRTKFSQDQKQKMHDLAEKLGWKMQKASDDMVTEFCNDVGVERGVFKVWMHNNKNTFGKRDLNGNIRPGIIIGNANDSGGNPVAGGQNGSSGTNESHGYSKNGDGTYGSSTSS